MIQTSDLRFNNSLPVLFAYFSAYFLWNAAFVSDWLDRLVLPAGRYLEAYLLM